LKDPCRRTGRKENTTIDRFITRLEAENLLLRQQLVVLRHKSPRRVRLWNIDRLLLVWLYRLYPSLLDAIIIVQPETVIRWHRRGFRAYWRWKSRHVGGRPRIDSDIRALIRRMSRENPLWGAPRIHGELLMLGIEVAESLTVMGWTQPRSNGFFSRASDGDHDHRKQELREGPKGETLC